MLRSRRLPRKAAIALVLLAVLIGLPHGSVPAHHAKPGAGRVVARTLSATKSDHATAPSGTSATAGRTQPAGADQADHPACSVPGIGDIGGLLGFCSLGSSGLVGGINNLCNPGVPQPESASSGIDSLISPPEANGPRIATAYNEYGMSGQYWAATNLQCSDMTSLIGNDVAGMIFDLAKSLDRVTITVYQAAAGQGILSWLQNVTDRLVSSLGKAIYFPYVALVVILGAIWLAWQGLIRKRGTRTIEGTLWMVLACAAAIWLIGRPADFTGLGTGVSDGISATLNTAFAHLPSPGQASCVPVKSHDPQISESSFAYTSGTTVVDQNANELWTVLVCKPWLDGEFGTTAYSVNGKPTAVTTFGRQLLWSQAIAVNERPTTALINAKQASYAGIAQTIKQDDPSVYSLFQGKEWTTRLEIAFAAMLAAVVAGILILLISVTLILLKLGFLLLLIVGPFFLLIGTHPGFGRVVAIRWVEMLVGVLLKQAAVALALSVLLYCYALIMGTSDAVLPWALKILMITLVTVAVFIYRKPFQHLFTAVGYGAIGSTDRAEAEASRAASTARANTMTAALAVPGFAAYRAARWARRNPAQAAGLALGTGTGSTPAGASGSANGSPAEPGGLDPSSAGAAAGAATRARAWGSSTGATPASQAPPLRLPSAQGSGNGPARSGAATGPWAGSAGRSGNGSAPPAPSVRIPRTPRSGSAGPAGPASWSTRGTPARSSRPAGPKRADDGSQGRAAPPDAARSSRNGSADRRAPGGGPADRVRADRGQKPAGTAAASSPPRQGRPGRSARPGRPPSTDAADHNASGGGAGMIPFGLGPGGDEEHQRPFWSRPARRRK